MLIQELYHNGRGLSSTKNLPFVLTDAIVLSFLYLKSLHSTITNVPAPISRQPTSDFTVNCSCRKMNASASVMSTDSLSMGTTPGDPRPAAAPGIAANHPRSTHGQP